MIDLKLSRQVVVPVSLAFVFATAFLLAAVEDTRPAAGLIGPSRPMAEPYRILLTRSIFSRDHNKAAPISRNTSPAPSTQESHEAATADPAFAESNFIFNGVAIVDGVPTALFEQTALKQHLQLHPGDTLAHGSIALMTLDRIEYIAHGKSVYVSPGFSLDGGQSSTTQPTTEPSTSGDQPSDDKPSWWRRRK